MKLKNLACTQFAGVRDREIAFADGINVIYGKNESGKSTMVNLLSRTLFQNAKVGKQTAEDKKFRALYFPGELKDGGVAGDFADGRLTLETAAGTYRLEKEWGADARCLLATPDGMTRDPQKIDEILRDVLLYGEGVYADLLLSSQRNTDVALQALLDVSQKTAAKAEISDVVTRAFAESDGVSINAVEQEIQRRIDDIAGKHWDFDREKPVQKPSRWSKELGEILKAYYAWEDAVGVQKQITELEAAVDRATGRYAAEDVAVGAAEAACNEFNQYADRLNLRSERQKRLTWLENELRTLNDVLDDWPVRGDFLRRAKKLQQERDGRKLLDDYAAVAAIQARMSDLADIGRKMPSPTLTEIQTVRGAEKTILALENSLCAMNLTAAVKMLGGDSVQITSVRTGAPVDIVAGVAAINEAVNIVVPGVMEMQLTPANVDAALVNGQIAAARQGIDEIFAKYRVDSVDGLEQLVQAIHEKRSEYTIEKDKLKHQLQAAGFAEPEQLRAAAVGVVGDVRPAGEIAADIAELCGARDINELVITATTKIRDYEKAYGTESDLRTKINGLQTERTQTEQLVTEAENIPAEFAAIAAPKAHLQQLNNRLKLAQQRREQALEDKTAATSRLESYCENISGDAADAVERAERRLNEQKTLLRYWLHIREVFLAQKEGLNANPMQDIAQSFTNYLGVITGGSVSSEFPYGDRLEMQVYSENRRLDFGKLSEGTKDTVSLAFRLAVLDHLFPEGGGIIVLDDPFTDMDAERTAQACRLVQECATRHQVILLTCKEEYLDMLGGNRILL